MSQAKVDQHKIEKANRKKTMAKEKRNRMIAKICATVVGLGLLVWIGISVVEFVKENKPVETIYCDTTPLDEYINVLYAEETESVEDTESEAETEVEETTEAE